MRFFSVVLLALGFFVIVSSFPRAAKAADVPGEEQVEPLDRRALAAWDHIEMSMGFLAGQRSYTKTAFGFGDGTGAPPGAASLVEPFQHAPYDNVNVYGLRYEARLVVSYVRMTAGFDLPFSSFRLGDSGGRYDVGGTPMDISVRSLGTKDLRFGIGAEYPIGPVAPYVDLIGSVHWVSTTLSVGGTPVDFTANSFAFAARGGIRLHVRRWFFAAASGEVGLTGDMRWGADLSVGVAFM
jgi:hypothetical protein